MTRFVFLAFPATLALILSGALWTAGRFVVLSPALARTLLVGALLASALTLIGTWWARRRPWLALIFATIGLASLLSAALYPWRLLHPSGPGIERWSAGADAVPIFDQLRVVQLNVWHGYPELERQEERALQLEKLLGDTEADVLVLNEVWSVRGQQPLVARLAEGLGFEAAYARANGSRRLLGFEEGTAVLSRYPIRAVRRIPLEPHASLFERRIALFAEIEVPERGTVEIVGAHLHHRDAEVAEAQAVALLGHLDPAERQGDAGRGSKARPLVVAGDFNLTSDSRALRSFETADYENRVPEGVDHLLVDRHGLWRVLWSHSRPTLESSGLQLSDHPLLVAEIEPRAPPPSSRWRGSWIRTSAEATGMDGGRLARTVAAIGELDGVECVLVVRDGRLVAEEYFRGARPETLRNLKSVSKSVLSAVTGIAVERGVLALDDPISGHLPAARSLDDPNKRSITVENLLSMKSGLESTSFGNYGSWVSSRDWVAAALDRPLLEEPGQRMRYSTGDTHLLSAVLTAASGTSTLELAGDGLFEPLGIERVTWARDPRGIYFGGNNLQMTARDLARFGQLYLDRGRWGDRQVVPWQWVDRSTRSSDPGWTRGWGGYGWLWWLRPPEEQGAFTANGFGGQYLYVAPAHDLAVVIGSTVTSKGRPWRRELFGLIVDGVVGSVRERLPIEVDERIRRETVTPITTPPP